MVNSRPRLWKARIRGIFFESEAMSRNLFFGTAIVLFAASIASASATPPRWQQGFEIGVGCNDPVTSSARLGDGRYVVGGEFSNCGDVAVPGLAIFDPSSGKWNAFDPPPPENAQYPRMLHASGSDLVVVSTFGGISHWDGSGWAELGPSNSEMASAAILDGEIYAAGYFWSPQDSGYRVARWSGTGWTALGAAPDRADFDDSITSLVVFRGELHAAGYFRSIGRFPSVAANHIARWNGTAWTPVGSSGGNGIGGMVPGVGLKIWAMTVWNDALYVTGQFLRANEGAPGGAVEASRIARWDGAEWSAVGSGLQDGSSRLIAGTSAGLFVGGTFTGAGGVPVQGLARWNGLQWSALPGAPTYGLDEILSLSGGNSGVVVGGRFGIVSAGAAGQLVTNHVAEWNGSHWSKFGDSYGAGVNGPIAAVAQYRGEVYIGGAFTSAGGKSATNIARWDGSEWHPLGTQTSNGVDHHVLGFATMGDRLVIGGRFERAHDEDGTIETHLIATWDGDAFSPVGNDDLPGQGRVTALLWSPPNLYVAGWLGGPNASDPQGVVRWDGSNWHALGTPPYPGVFGGPNAVAMFDDQLHVGGYVSAARRADGTLLSLNKLARWTGSDWEGVGVGQGNGVGHTWQTQFAIHALAAYGGDLYVAGSFDVVNPVPPPVGEQLSDPAARMHETSGPLTTVGLVEAKGVVRWTGESWQALGAAGAGPSGRVNALSVTRDGVYAGGSLVNVLDPPATLAEESLAVWSEGRWADVGARLHGLRKTVYALSSDSRRGLYVAGDFGAAGGAVASHFSYYDADPDTIFVSDFDR